MKRKVKNRFLEASSLLFTIYVSLVLYLIAASFVLLYFLYSNYINQAVIQSDLKNLCRSAANLYLSNPVTTLNKKLLIENDWDFKNIQIDKNYWGFFEVIDIEAQQGKNICKGSYLVGALNAGTDALYIADNNRFVSVSGNTAIIGNIVVPGAHIQRKNFYGSIIPVDSLRKSSSTLPQINQGIINNLPINRNLLDKITTENNFVEYNNLRNQKISNPFTDSLIVIYSGSAIALTDIELFGKIIVFSEKKIDVYSSASLTDVIVFAPEIEIHMGFNGSGQFLSDSLIKTGSNCNFSYPSVICTISKNSSNIQISGGTKIAGGIIHFNKQTNNNSKVKIDKNCSVYGTIYSTQMCELGGNVYGGIYAKTINSPELTSENNIISNVLINHPALRDEFVLPLIFDNQLRDIIDHNYLFATKQKPGYHEVR